MTPIETNNSSEATAPLYGLAEFDIKRIPLSFVREDHGTQIRGEVSSSQVRCLTAILNETDTDLDAIDVFLEPGSGAPGSGNQVWLGDGFHRMAVYRGLQKPKIPARIHFGGKSEAIEFGLRKQGKHGMPMSSKQKRHAAEVAVMDSRIGEFPDIKIARIIGVSPSLVSMARRGVKTGHGSAAPVEPLYSVYPEESAADPESGSGTPPAKRSRKTAASGKRESESTAPASASVRQRKDTEALNRPTKAALLKRIDTELSTGCIDEEDLIHLMRSPMGRWAFLPKDGESVMLKVVGVSGREQVSVPCTIKEVTFEQVTLKYTAGRLKEY